MMIGYYFLFLTIISCCIVQNHSYKFTAKYIDVPIDHFSIIYNATFKLRYLVNDSYFNNNSGCIFFFTGNQYEISFDAQAHGFLFDIAPTFNALIVFAEHRYYGKSLPYGNNSLATPQHSQFLSTRQVLADFVDLISKLQNTYSGNQDLPVIAFGGGYSGMLASWLRMKYPHMVIGTLASSAPVWLLEGITPCENLNKALTDVFIEEGTSACTDGIKKSWSVIRDLTKNDVQKKKISNLWKLCKPLETSQDINNFLAWLHFLYLRMAMVNYPYSNSFLKTPVPANTVKRFCSRFIGGQNNDFLQALQYATEVYSNFTQKVSCIDLSTDITPFPESMKASSFQSCTEILLPECSTDQDMLENYDWNYEKRTKQCVDFFGVAPKSRYFLIEEYGGKHIEAASNIIFSNGLLNPWSTGGVLKNISSTVIAVVLPKTSYQQDVRAANPADPESIIAARKLYVAQFKLWIDQFKP